MAGDRIRIPPFSPSPRTLAREKKPVRHLSADYSILYEDDDFMVLNKPSGLAVHGGTGIVAGLIERIRATQPVGAYLELAHRLDRSTSGCLVFAKHRSSLIAIHAALRAGQLDKCYLALLRGSPPWNLRTVEDSIARSRVLGGERISQIAPDGKRARSHFRIVRRWPMAALAEIRIETGRTHQIRVHAASLGHPIAGDEKYGEREFNRLLKTRYGLKRLFLHARALTLTHPGTNEPFTVQAPLPTDLESTLLALDQAASAGDPETPSHPLDESMD
ncbi:ribosomal large subunit pseudouridine synthase C [mine drainage metagenome]|uniref:Ribosomal large subunit pseudouridine synthase C n=2 Tax=mine drainage metagenome TaxID=410659 RepID=T1C5N1_9ZZZZ